MTVNSHEFSEKLPIDSFGYFLSILGMREKRLPTVGEMPEKIFLSSSITHTLWDALIYTNKIGKEIGFSLSAINGEIKSSRYIIGTEESVGSFFDQFRMKRELADIHTHTSRNSPGFSDEDMAIFFSYPNSGYLFMSVSNGGISALARTQETAKIPFSSSSKWNNEIKNLRNGNLANTNLTERGYVYYEWANTYRTFHQQGKDGSGFYITNPLEYPQIGSGIDMVKKDLIK